MISPDEYLAKVTETIRHVDRARVDEVVSAFERAYREGRRLFTCGNGGSASTASHLVCDFQKSLIGNDGRSLKAFALTDSQPLITAWANDSEYADIFANQLGVLAEPGDMLLAISGSGNSPNVLRAVERARSMGVYTIGWTGFDGGALARSVDLSLNVPVYNMQIAEDLHMIVGHLVFTQLMRQFAPVA